MVVKIQPGVFLEVKDDVRCVRFEWVAGGSLLVTLAADGQTVSIAVEPREIRQVTAFLAGGG